MRTSLILLLYSAGHLAAQQAGAVPRLELVQPGGVQPGCDAAHRGSTVLEMGTAGTPDLLKVCLKDGTERFAWVNASQQNPNTFVHPPKAGGCPLFPDNNVWNTKIDGLPEAAESKGIIHTYATMKLGLVPAFILNVADTDTPTYAVSFRSPESDGGKYPVTPEMEVEGYAAKNTFPVSKGPYQTDAHLLVVRKDQCKLYEIYALASNAPPYPAGSGAIYDLTTNDLRPDGWTSADAAGLPIWPGVLTYAEMYGEGEIRHMVRFTVSRTRSTYVWPARHYASRSGEVTLPPMGSRWRLKASFDETTCRTSENAGQPFPPEMQRLIRALKHYGMILADNGLAIKISTDADRRWGDPESPSSATWVMNGWCHCMSGEDFEVVNAQPLMVNANSAETVQ
jgi:hypothetical protein